MKDLKQYVDTDVIEKIAIELIKGEFIINRIEVERDSIPFGTHSGYVEYYQSPVIDKELELLLPDGTEITMKYRKVIK